MIQRRIDTLYPTFPPVIPERWLWFLLGDEGCFIYWSLWGFFIKMFGNVAILIHFCF
jgi:hypothetical protein